MRISRRRLIIAGAAMTLSRRLKGAAGRKVAIRLGGPVSVESDDPDELAEAHLKAGYHAAYAPKVKLDDRNRLQAIVKAFASRDIVIAEVGAWVNMLDPDTEKRSQNLAYVTERLALADELNARCCVAIAGSFNADVWYGPHPQNLSRQFFDQTVENVRKLIDTVKPKRTKFTLEMMGWALPTNPDEYLDLMKAIDRPEFGVHVDICNMINSARNIYQNATLIRECFSKLARWVASCHAKDVAWEPALQIHFKEVIPGRGLVDYSTYLNQLSRHAPEAPLMLEHLGSDQEYTEAARYIRAVARRNNIPISDL